MTLTREQLLELGKPRIEEVDVPGVGKVWLRSLSEVKRAQRDVTLWDESGQPVSNFQELVRVYAIIDQVCMNESEPMFSDADVSAVQEMDHAITRPLYEAVRKFNGENDAKKNGAALKDSSGD